MENLDRSLEIPENKRQRKLVRSVSSPEGGGEPCEFEAEYWEVRPGVWEIIPGTTRKVRPAPRKENEKFQEQ